MRWITFVYVLYKVHLLTPISIYRLCRALIKSGLNLMTLLEIAARRYPNQIAIIDDQKSMTYKDLITESNLLANYFVQKYHLKQGQTIGVLCRNHLSLIQAIFAISRLGADICLLNTEMGKSQLKQLIKGNQYDAVIYDSEFDSMINELNLNGLTKIRTNWNLAEVEELTLPRASGGKIILQTGGTTGKPKEAGHAPSIFNYLNPFIAFINRLKLLDYESAYIGTPIFHGYGIAVLLTFIALGKKCVITSRFDAAKACQLVRKHQIEFMTAVPIMVDRMLQYGSEYLTTLKCIASGGARLHPSLIQQTFEQLGDVLYNLYGTSEGGLLTIATPEDLSYSPLTVGRKISGLKLIIANQHGQEVQPGNIGDICIKNNWSMQNRKNQWLKTGDLGYITNGYLFLSGRNDEMIVSGGENVFPADLEYVLTEHPSILDAVVVGVKDQEFGERLIAFVMTQHITEEELFNWLQSRIARYQMPKQIIFVEQIPYTPVGKPNKKKILEMFNSDT